MIRLLVSVSLLMFLSLAAAQPIEDYTVVCRVDATEEEGGSDDTTTGDDGETMAIEVVEEEQEDGDEVIGVASNVDGTWHVSLDREASCEGDVVLVPYGDDEEDVELDAEVTSDEEGGSTTLTIGGPVESDDDGTEGDETTGEDEPSDETTDETTDEPTEVEANEVPDVAIEGKRRARENRNEAWDGRPGPPEWAGGDDEEDEASEESEESEESAGAEADASNEEEPPEPPDADEAAGERDEEGERRGPPDFAGPPNGDDDADDEDDEDEDDDEDRGPPEGRGGPPEDGAGPPDAPGRP